MYTQCSKCETVFKLSAEVLRAAGGQVRCGKCGEVFNALSRLAEDAGTFEIGESSLELETRADGILESVPSLPVAAAESPDSEELAPAGVEIAHLEILGLSDDDLLGVTPGEASMEFTLPPGELDRIFVESKKPTRTLPPLAASIESAPTAEKAVAPDVRNGVSGFDVPDTVRSQMLAGIGDDAESTRIALLVAGAARNDRRIPPAGRRSFIPWLCGALLSALLLVAQVMQQNPRWFAGTGAVGSATRALFSSLGAPLAVPANLATYQLRQWGVTGDPAANGILRVRASILNVAAQLQPYPLLRVTLANRFGSRIGSRDFEPAEYLGKPTARLLSPGERADATLDILDPGKNAEGFEIDVCLRQTDHKISCASDVAPQIDK